MAPKRKFRDCWLEDETLNDWLIKNDDNENVAACRYCKKEFLAEISIIKRHKVINYFLNFYLIISN